MQMIYLCLASVTLNEGQDHPHFTKWLISTLTSTLNYISA